QFERHEPRQQSRGIDLADDGLDIGETARIGMQWRNVAIAGGRQGYEAEVDEITGNGEVAVKWRKIRERIRRGQGDEAVQGHEYQPDDEIEQDGADDAVV